MLVLKWIYFCKKHILGKEFNNFSMKIPMSRHVHIKMAKIYSLNVSWIE